MNIIREGVLFRDVTQIGIANAIVQSFKGMRFLPYILLFISCALVGQTKLFTLTDTNLTIGQTYITRQIGFELSKKTLRKGSNVVLDSIVKFMEKNKHIVLEIGVHSDNRESELRSSSNLSQGRAQNIADYLVSKGIQPQRLTAKGWGRRKLLINDEQINKAKTLEEKEALHALNRRVELKVIGVQKQ